MTKKRRAGGDCYEAAATLALYPSDQLARQIAAGAKVFVAHGTVWHEAVGWHGHAWIEIERQVWIPQSQEAIPLHECLDKSNGHDAMMPAAVYYYLGRVKDVHRYTVKQARAEMLRTRVYGPWQEE